MTGDQGRVILAGALDTKGEEYDFVRGLLTAAGLSTLLVDTGIRGTPATAPDVTREEVARAGGRALAEVAGLPDRAAALDAMAEGLSELVRTLHDAGDVAAAFGMGGSGRWARSPPPSGPCRSAPRR